MISFFKFYFEPAILFSLFINISCLGTTVLKCVLRHQLEVVFLFCSLPLS